MHLHRDREHPRHGPGAGRRAPAPATSRPGTDARRRSSGAPLGLRLRVLIRRDALERRIALGDPCYATPELALRSTQLIDRRLRERTARHLRSVVDYADRAGSSPVISAVVIDRDAVEIGREAVLGLAERLESDRPVAPRGVALARALLTDGTSPLFGRRRRGTVVDAIWVVADALNA